MTLRSLPVLLALFLVGCTKTGREGEWLETTYSFTARSFGQEKSETSRVKVKVAKSAIWKTGDKIVVFVLWQAENVDKVAMPYAWNNKHLMDGNGNFFSPESGRNTPRLQPTETANPVPVRYVLPPTAMVDQLDWGWFDPDKKTLTYRIRLAPQAVDHSPPEYF